MKKDLKDMTDDELHEQGFDLMVEMAYMTREKLRLEEMIKDSSLKHEQIDAEIERRDAGPAHITNQ